jgi:hypothetical protein
LRLSLVNRKVTMTVPAADDGLMSATDTVTLSGLTAVLQPPSSAAKTRKTVASKRDDIVRSILGSKSAIPETATPVLTFRPQSRRVN